MRHPAVPKLRTLGALICLVALTAATQPAAAEEDCPRVSVVADEQRLYSVAVDYCDGRGPQGLTRGDTPRLSPDRSRIVFSGFNSMWIMNVDGTEQRILLEASPTGGLCSSCDFYPRFWSPDGQLIYFNFGALFMKVGVIGADGSNPRKLGDGEVASGAWPAPMSPDGTMVMLGGQPDETPYLGAMVIATGTYLHVSDGRAPTGSWSPDSRWVAFTYLTSFLGRTGL